MSHAAKHRIYEQFARIGKAIAAPARLELLDLLAQGERSVDALATASELSVANASQHLQVLASASLVESRREGQRVIYRLADESVQSLLLAVRRTAEHRLAELDTVAKDYLIGRDEFEPISQRELVRRMKDGSVTLIDVRPREEYDQGHLPGAISVAIEELAAWARTTPKSQQVVAYCRGPYCVFAIQAVTALRKRGVRAVRFEEGVPEWRAAGLPIETAAP